MVVNEIWFREHTKSFEFFWQMLVKIYISNILFWFSLLFSLAAKIVNLHWTANTWEKTVFPFVKNVIKNFLVLNVPIAIDTSAAKYCKLVITIIFIQRVHVAQNVEIHLVMVKRCICKGVLVSTLIIIGTIKYNYYVRKTGNIETFVIDGTENLFTRAFQ